MGVESKWTFARVIDTDCVASMSHLSPGDLYRMSLNSRETKRKLFQTALTAALENIMSWERIARAQGFVVEFTTDTNLGELKAVFENGLIQFVQAYGVIVSDEKERVSR